MNPWGYLYYHLYAKFKTMPEITGSLATTPIVIPSLPEKLPVLTVTESQWVDTTQLVIDGVEGGYYHPDMKKNFNARSQKALGDSGETMFGLDRKHGSQLAKYPEWARFWDLVDKAQVGVKWKYNSRGGAMESVFKELAAKIMYKWFQYLAGKYILISSMDEIANDKRLLFHFSYASWNGEGWFERYAKALNAAIAQFPGNKEAIYKQAIKARTESTNSVIRQQGANMLLLFKKYKITG
jgi:hypothetical protein